MANIFTKRFLKAAGERAVKTLCQVAAATIIANGTGLIDTDWIGVLSTSGMAALLSVLTSVGSDTLTEGDGPSFGGAENLT